MGQGSWMCGENREHGAKVRNVGACNMQLKADMPASGGAAFKYDKTMRVLDSEILHDEKKAALSQ